MPAADVTLPGHATTRGTLAACAPVPTGGWRSQPQGGRARLGDVDAQAPVDARAAHADEDAAVDAGPGGPRAGGPSAVRAGAVLRQRQQRAQRGQVALVLLQRHPLGLPRVAPGPAPRAALVHGALLWSASLPTLHMAGATAMGHALLGPHCSPGVVHAALLRVRAAPGQLADGAAGSGGHAHSVPRIHLAHPLGRPLRAGRRQPASSAWRPADHHVQAAGGQPGHIRCSVSGPQAAWPPREWAAQCGRQGSDEWGWRREGVGAHGASQRRRSPVLGGHEVRQRARARLLQVITRVALIAPPACQRRSTRAAAGGRWPSAAPGSADPSGGLVADR